MWIWKCGAPFSVGVQIDPSNKNSSNDSHNVTKIKTNEQNPISI